MTREIWPVIFKIGDSRQSGPKYVIWFIKTSACQFCRVSNCFKIFTKWLGTWYLYVDKTPTFIIFLFWASGCIWHSTILIGIEKKMTWKPWIFSIFHWKLPFWVYYPIQNQNCNFCVLTVVDRLNFGWLSTFFYKICVLVPFSM